MYAFKCEILAGFSFAILKVHVDRGNHQTFRLYGSIEMGTYCVAATKYIVAHTAS